MTLLLMISRSVLLTSVGLYLYLFSQRKKKDVVIQMWLTIVGGMSAGLVNALVDVKLGNYTWATVQISLVLYSGIIIYSLWKLSIELNKRRR